LRVDLGQAALWTCALVAFTLPGSSARANGEVTVGWEGDARRGSLFGDGSWNVGGDRRHIVAVGATGTMLYYRLFEEGEEIRVNSTGGGLDLTATFPVGTCDLAVGPGIELVRERTVFDSGEVSREWALGPTLDIRFDVPVDSSTFGALSFNYSRASRYFWLRSALFTEAFEGRPEGSGERSIGAEFTVQGSNDFKIYQAGPVFQVGFPRQSVVLHLRGGYSLLRSLGDQNRPGGYFGAEISYQLHLAERSPGD
jgi:hypothetical protein